MKRYSYPLFVILLLTLSYPVFAQQSVLNPNDSIVNYDPDNPPVRPNEAGVMTKWVRTLRMGWNTSPYKAYYYSTGVWSGLPFRLLFPKSYGTNPNKKYPLLIFFHGAGEISKHGPYDNELQLVNCGKTIMQAVENGDFDGFVIFPQVESGYWPGAFPPLVDIINYMAQHNHLDKSRITVGGLSMGGSGTWEFTKNYPRLVAGSTPISAADRLDEKTSVVDSLQSIPIWISQGGRDRSPEPAITESLLEYLRAHRVDVRYTLYPNKGHGVWNAHYAEPDAFSWMTGVNKTNPHVYSGQTEYCVGESFKDTLSLTAGFEAYQWSKNGQVIPGATSNRLTVTDTGTYAARYKMDGEWTYWSPDPVEITYRSFTQTPPIKVSGLMSRVIPAPDGRTSVTLTLPPGYESYEWRNASGQVLGTDYLYLATQAGKYVATVSGLIGCPALPSDTFYVASADGSHAPDAASGLTGTALSHTAIQLHWSDKLNPVYNETAFEIYRGKQSGGGYKLAAIVPADSLDYKDEDLTPGTDYFYIVRAIGKTAAAPVSAEAKAVTLSDTQAPGAPANLIIKGATPGSVSLYWTASNDNVGVKNYGVYINGVRTYITSDTAFTVLNLTYGQSYAFTVKAFDASENKSPASNQVIANAVPHGLVYKYYTYNGTWNSLPDLNSLSPDEKGWVDNITLTSATQSASYAFSFQGYINIPEAGEYTFYTSSDDGSNLYINNMKVVDNDGAHGTQEESGSSTFSQPGMYPFRVDYFQGGGAANLAVFWKKSDSLGFSKSLIPDSAFIEKASLGGIAPAFPADITAEAISYDSVKISWEDKSSDETGFEIYRSTQSGEPYQIIYTSKKDSVSYTDTTVAPSTTYYYKVQAINQYGASGYDPQSDNNQTTTLDLPPAPDDPSGLVAMAVSTDKINLDWEEQSVHKMTFELFRSMGDDSAYRRVADLPVGSHSYTDSALFGNTVYFYKIQAINAGGESGFSNEANATTKNHAPDIVADTGYYTRYDGTLEAEVTASDKDNEQLTLMATNLPSFGSFQDNGDGSGAFAFSPSAETQQGYYPNIKVLVADQHGDKDSTTFSLTVGDLYLPDIQPVSQLEVNTFEFSQDTFRLSNGNSGNGITWQTERLPGFVKTGMTGNGNLVLKTAPEENDPGSYSFKVIASNSHGMSDTATVEMNVHAVSLKEWYMNFASSDSWRGFPGSPWNNLRGDVTTDLKDNEGQTSDVGLELQTNWWSVVTKGAQKNGNDGVYPNNVMRDNFFFGRLGGPDEITGKVTGLDPSRSYALTFFASSTWGFTNDNGHTVFQIGSRKDSVHVQGNTDKTVTLANVTPSAEGMISFTMSKGSDADAGYLNALVVSTLASMPPAVATNIQLSNETVDGANAVQVNWKNGSKNAHAIEIYRSTQMNSGYSLLNENAANGSAAGYTDTTVSPTSSVTYYYYLVASNTYGSSLSTDTVSITTNQYIDKRKWNLNFASSDSWRAYPGIPWNNIREDVTTGLEDSDGQNSSVGLKLQTDWWRVETKGTMTGDNSGVYSDNVLRDNYYFGRNGGPEEVTGKVTGLDPAKSYALTFFASSYWGFTPDNGHTVFQVGSRKDSIYVQQNTDRTVTFGNITPSEEGTVSFTMSKGADAGAGYLNAIVVNTLPDLPPSAPTDLKLNNETVDGANAVKVNWQPGSKNANTIEIYRSAQKNSGYTLLNEGLDNGFAEHFMDTTVSPTSSVTYYYYLVAANAYGSSLSTDTVSITTNQYIDKRKWYLNFASSNSWRAYPDSPWNNIREDVTTDLKDNGGLNSSVGFALQTDWWRVETKGTMTGDNSGVYSDNVLRDNYYFGRNGGSEEVTGKVTGLDPAKSYALTFFASSYWGFTPDNGHTVFQVGTKKDSIYVQRNTDKTVTLANITPSEDGTISFTMSKGADAGAGYLNALVVSTLPDMAPAVPTNLQLSNETVNGANAVQLDWIIGSKNAQTIEIYRSTARNNGYTLLNEGSGNGNTEDYMDTTVSPTSSVTYNYYLVASNAYGSSVSTDTVSITTSQYVDQRKWYMNFASSDSWRASPSSPWNNLREDVTTNLKDSDGQNSSVGLALQTNWWRVDPKGSMTGDNSGVYSDNVLRDTYYFGRNGGPDEVTGKVTGLDSSKRYALTFFASSYWGFTPDNGHTVFQVGSQKDSIHVQENTDKTVTFGNITPSEDGSIHFTMSKGADAGAGYLNALVVNTQAGIPPAAPVNIQLSNEVVDESNAIKASWQPGSNNTDTIYLYKATSKTGTYTLLNPGSTGMDTTSYIDTAVSPLNAAIYYYYLLASNEHGYSDPTDTIAFSTPNLFPVKPVHLALTQKVVNNQYAVALGWQLPTDNVQEIEIYKSGQKNSGYTLLSSLSAEGGATAYTDMEVTLSSDYYYYLIAKNGFGVSGASDTASISFVGTTPLTPPVLAAIPETHLVAGAEKPIQISANASGEEVIFSLYHAPSFARIEAEGKQTAKVILTPDVSDVGDYDSLQVVATDSVGSTDTAYFNIHVIDSSRLPIMPEHLSLTKKVTDHEYHVVINWQLPTDNLDEVDIYKATEKNGSYSLLTAATGDSSATGYTDTTVSLGTTTYYFLVGKNGYGSSASTDTASVALPATPPVPPVIATIPTTYVAAGVEDTLSISAATPAGSVAFSLADAPSFVGIHSTGSKTAEIILKPDTSDIGTYDSLQVVAVNPEGFSDTVYFDLYVTEGNLLPEIRLNFTETGNTYTHSWNNIVFASGNNIGYNKLVNDAGKATDIGLTVIAPWSGTQTDGANTYSNSGFVPDSVMATGYYIDNGTSRTLQLSGLEVTRKYNLVFFASSNNGGNTDYTTDYTINGDTVSLNGIRNTDKAVRINGLIPDQNGDLTIAVTRDGNASQGLLNAMILQAYEGNKLVAPNQLTAVAGEEKVMLQWADRSDNEQQFRILRAEALNGTYANVGQVSANTTSFVDPGVAANTRYFYKVLAVSTDNKTMPSEVASVTTPQMAVYVNFNLKEDPAPAPWNNTQAPPQEGAVYGLLLNSQGNNTGIILNMGNNFEGENPFGFSTGNNSGLYPDLVMQSIYYMDNGLDTVVMKVSNLNMAMKYNLTFYGSIVGYGWQNTTQYIANGQLVGLETSYNTDNTVTLSNLSPDNNGQIVVKIIYTSSSNFAVLNAMVISAYDNYDDQGNKIVDPNLYLRVRKVNEIGVSNKIEGLEGDSALGSFRLMGSAYPNPFHQFVRFKLNSPLTGKLDLSLYEMNGRLIERRTEPLSEGMNVIQYQPHIDLQSGMYILSLRLTGTRQMINMKIIKQ